MPIIRPSIIPTPVAFPIGGVSMPNLFCLLAMQNVEMSRVRRVRGRMVKVVEKERRSEKGGLIEVDWSGVVF